MTGADAQGRTAARILAIGTAAMFVGLALALVAAGLWDLSRGASVGLGIGGLWAVSVGIRMRWKARRMLERINRTRP